jgi:hypothetical protein
MTRKPKAESGLIDPKSARVNLTPKKKIFYETCENHASFVRSFRVNLTRGMSDFEEVLCSRLGTECSETQLNLFLKTGYTRKSTMTLTYLSQF